MTGDSCSVSVVIPAFNAADTIERAVESVLAQTLSPLEVIIVDDCSDAAHLQVYRKLGQLYPETIRLVVLEENKGPSVARNYGWDLAAGEYIAFLDADDSWHPQKLEFQCDWMRRNPDIVISGHLAAVSCSGLPVELLGHRELHSIRYGYLQSLFSNRLATRTVMLRRSLHLRFNVSLRRSEDYNLWCRIARATNRIDVIQACLAYSHKSQHSPIGLSGDLIKMQVGQMSSITDLFRRGYFSPALFALLLSWSVIRFSRRLAMRVAWRIGTFLSIEKEVPNG